MTSKPLRLFIDQPLQEGAEVALLPDQAHYLATVMRRGIGDEVLVFNGKQGEFLANISAMTKKAVAVKIGAHTKAQTASPDIWLIFAPVKRAPIDQIAQKATELGVSALQPVFTERTIVTRVKTDRLLANAIEAAEQTERLDIPEIFAEKKLAMLLAHWEKHAGNRRLLFCDEEMADGKKAPSVQAALEPFKENPGKWAILVGPEGGFTEQERSTLLALPFVTTAHLGPRILRADTAAWAALTLWQASLGDLG